MWKFWKHANLETPKDLAKSLLEKHREVFESLKEYDEGKKDISTTNVREHLRDLL